MQLDAEIGKEGLTRRGHYGAVLTKQHISALDERIGQRGESGATSIRSSAQYYMLQRGRPRRYPGPSLQFHLIQLVAYDTSLFLERGYVLASFLVNAAERSPLQYGGTKGKEPYKHEQPSGADKPARYRYQ
jgi:hypothetical protein